MNLPNTITLGRIFLVPLLVVVLLTKFNGKEVFGISNEVLGATIFAVASLTDWLDGYLARRRKQVTELGQWIDPLADKLLVTAAFISLVQLGYAAAWMVAIILGREFSVTVLRGVVHSRGQTLPASSVGKIKMVVEVVAFLVLILGHGVPALFRIGQVALWVATIAAIVSAIEYSRWFNRGMAARHAPAAVVAATRKTAAAERAGRISA